MEINMFSKNKIEKNRESYFILKQVKDINKISNSLDFLISYLFLKGMEYDFK